MTKPLRWGILGAAKFAREHMAPAMMLAKNTELAALATSSADKAAAFTSLHPSLQIHSDYDDLLNNPAIGAVYIPLPNHLHVEWVKRAVEAGKHVLCEKPIAMQADEIDELITLRDRAGVLVAEAYMIVHHPQWHYAKELVDAGEIGTVQQIDTVFSYNNAADTGNIRNRAETGGGGLRDIGVYTLGCARYVMGAKAYITCYRVCNVDRCQIVCLHSIELYRQGNNRRGCFQFACSGRDDFLIDVDHGYLGDG